MSPLNALIFGLGLFFLGLRLVGDNLRALVGGGFRSVITRTTHSPALGGALGVVVGALMQSATAVTFILVGMMQSGLITSRAAAPIVVWSNVGLTALAFVTTLNIHPLVAFVVGGAGIVLGTVRVRTWQTVAGVLLGMGLILTGLEQMGAGAAPLKNAAWFQSGMHVALANPALTFLAGIAAAAILQSNTGAAMLVITFAQAGALSIESAALLIYGTNLGAIGLRVFLAAGLAGAPLRLVRLEDLFCIWSAALMLALTALETAGVPLILTWLAHSGLPIESRVAVIFLLSNLLPALTISPVLGPTQGFLKRLFPKEPAPAPGQPEFIRPSALDDPATAIDLLTRELTRLLRFIPTQPPTTESNPAFANLSDRIEGFINKLSSVGNLTESQAGTLHLLRAELSTIRHIEDAAAFFLKRFTEIRAAINNATAASIQAAYVETLHLAIRAADQREPDDIARLRDKPAKPTALAREADSPGLPPTASAVKEEFQMFLWSTRRLGKILERLPAATPPAQ